MTTRDPKLVGRTRGSRGAVALVVIALCAAAMPAMAYDGDTHYAWTYYLAIHVGYTPRQAYQLASAAWAIDHDAQTGPLHATKTDTYSGAPNPTIERVWRRFHAFADAVYVGTRPDVDAVSERRREGEATLAAIGVRQRNIGAQIHYLQDFFAHNEYDSVRGHAIWGHAPDRIGHRPNRARAMTKRTIQALVEFAPSVGVEPRMPDEERLWVVLDRLSKVNPPLLQVEPANYDLVWDAIGDLDLTGALRAEALAQQVLRAALGQPDIPRTIKQSLGIQRIAWGDVSLDAAVDVINAALVEDAEVTRVSRYPADWMLPKAWIQYDFDADGQATPETLAKKHFAVERLEVTFGEAKVSFRRDPSSASLYEVTAQQPYRLEGMATLPAFRAIPLVERSVWSDDSEQMQRDRERTNGSFVVERKVLRPRAALLDGSLKWNPSIELFGHEAFPAPEVTVRLATEYDWYVVTLNATGYDLRSGGGVDTSTGAGDHDARAGLHRRRGRADLVLIKVERGSSPAAAVAEIRKLVAEPHCRRAVSIAPNDIVEAPGASLAGLPQYWDSVSLEGRGPFASLDLANAAKAPARWDPLESVPNPNLDDIAFRSGCKSATPAPASLIAVPSVAGLSVSDAETRLRGAGLTAELVAGAAPSTRAEQYTIERQEPAANTRIAPGSRVRISVRPAYVEPSATVPSVAGLTVPDAEQRLRASGFVPQFAGGDPAPFAERAFTVQDQRPAAGETAQPNSAVVVRIYSAFERGRVVPNVVELTATAAELHLREVGLVADLQGGDPAPNAESAFKVQAQEPAPGTPVEVGARVRVRIHSAFTAAARTVEPSGTPPPSPVANPPSEGDPARFQCPPFANRSLPATTVPPSRNYSVECPARGDFYRYEDVRVAAYASWYASGSRPAQWTGACGGQPVFRFVPQSWLETSAGSIPAPAHMRGEFWSKNRLVFVNVQWFVSSERPFPPGLIDLAHKMMAEAEWRGRPCDGSEPATLAPLPAPPAPVRPPPAPSRATPTDARPLCTCTDASGRPYRMMFGEECDPTSSSRVDDCRP